MWRAIDMCLPPHRSSFSTNRAVYAPRRIPRLMPQRLLSHPRPSRTLIPQTGTHRADLRDDTCEIAIAELMPSEMWFRIIEAINSVPMFNYMLGARTEEELQALLKTPMPARVRTRVEGVNRTLATQIDIGLPKKAVPTLEARKAFLEPFLQVFEAAAVPSANRTVDQQALIKEYFAKSDASFSALLPKQLATLEHEIIGPLALGVLRVFAPCFHLLTHFCIFRRHGVDS